MNIIMNIFLNIPLILNVFPFIDQNEGFFHGTNTYVVAYNVTKFNSVLQNYM